MSPMCSPADGPSRLRRFPVALLVWLFAALGPTGGWAQDAPAPNAGLYEAIGPSLAAARLATASPDADPEEFAALRETLLGLRTRLSAALPDAQSYLDEANAQLKELGPAPPEGVEEPQALADQRRALLESIAKAQVPVLRAQKAQRELDAAIAALDAALRRRISQELLTRGPSPLLPQTWATGLAQLGLQLTDAVDNLRSSLAEPARQAAMRRTLPMSVLLVIAGIAIAISLRLRLTAWVERGLTRAVSPRGVAWLVVVRNVSRLILPLIGAGLLVAAFDPARLTGADTSFRIISLPAFLLAIIGAGWLGASLFAPHLTDYRLVPLDDAAAARASRITVLLGAVLAIHLLLSPRIALWTLPPAAAAILYFPLFVIGGYGLWRNGAILHGVRLNVIADQGTLAPAERTSVVGFGIMQSLEAAFVLAAVAVPLLGAAGYLAAARFLLFPMILTFGLLGTGVVIFDLIQKTRISLSPLRRKGKPAADGGGLAPVVVVALLLLIGAPLFALIWGARLSDLASFWLLLREGVSVGGVRISLGAILTFVFVFGIGYGIVSLLQSVLSSSVLPRTRLDAGGRNAILSGVGYLGFGLVLLIAVSSTGIDLSSLAIVAGALSVGIGFGLQNVVSNFVSGIILLIERPIKEGDWIEVGGYIGYVRRISVRSTELETFDRSSVIVPNSDLISGTVLNRTHKTMIGRLTVPVGVAYGSDPRHVERILRDVAENHPMTLEDPGPSILFMDFGASSLDFEIRCVLRDVNFVLSARSEMNFEIFERFREEGIEIPFPQMDIHMKRKPAAPPATGPATRS